MLRTPWLKILQQRIDLPIIYDTIFTHFGSKEVVLKWYYDENCTFPIAATLKHKQVACARRKMPFTYSNISFRSRDIQVSSFTQPNFDQI